MVKLYAFSNEICIKFQFTRDFLWVNGDKRSTHTIFHEWVFAPEDDDLCQCGKLEISRCKVRQQVNQKHRINRQSFEIV